MKKLTPPQNSKDFVKYSSLAFEMILIMGLGVFAGIKLDDWLNTSPVFTLILMIFSVIGAIFHAIKNFLNKH